MTVRCPRCGTLYRRPAHGAGESTYRCARCRHVFEDEFAEPAITRGPVAPADDEPAFVFDDEDVEADAEEMPEPPPARARRASAPAPGPAPKTDEAPTRPSRLAVLGFAVRTWLAVCLTYFVLSIYLYTHPEEAREVLGRVPLIGGALIETRLDPTSVQLSNVHGEYRRVKGDRLVFLIAGTATNDSPVAVKRIQVEGRLIGSREQRQVVFCGAAPHEVEELSLREIALLQTIEPPNDWALAPSEQADFVIVFTQPPPDLRSFTAEVVAVRSESHRGGPAHSTGDA